MFSNLSQGNVLYGLDTRGEYKIFASPITKASAPYPGYVNNNGVKVPCMVVDLAVSVDGDNREFKQVPSNISIADFGSIGFILADNKDSLKVYINSMVDSKKKAIDNIEFEKKQYEQYSKVADEINGVGISKQENEEIKNLRAELAEYRDIMKEFIALRKSETSKI